MRPIPTEALERFLRCMVTGAFNECWPWPKRKGGRHYTCIRVKGHFYKAHRISYAVAHGDPGAQIWVRQKYDSQRPLPSFVDARAMMPSTNTILGLDNAFVNAFARLESPQTREARAGASRSTSGDRQPANYSPSLGGNRPAAESQHRNTSPPMMSHRLPPDVGGTL